MKNKNLEELFKQFDMHYARIQNIMRQIEHAEKKREIDIELELILDKYNITRTHDDRAGRH